MELFDIRNWFAHNLCDYLREGDERALKELKETIEAVFKGSFPIPHLNLKEEEIDPFTEEFLKEKASSYQSFLKDLKEDFKPTQEEIERSVEVASLLFEKGLYFEVHELLEEVWMGEFGKNRDFLQALIQIGVAYYHLKNFNVRGFELLIDNALELLKGYRGEFFGVNVDSLKEALKRAKKTQEPISLKEKVEN